MGENLMIAIFLEAWFQSSPWPKRLDIRHRILAQFEAINQVAEARRRAADGHAPSAHPRGVSCRRFWPSSRWSPWQQEKAGSRSILSTPIGPGE
jgi:hypothetical protein